MSTPCLIIFGAAVKPDGTPSGAMLRRVDSALQTGKTLHGAMYLVTGGKGKFGPPEADVMASLLRDACIAEDHILADDRSPDTLASVVRCTQIVRDRHLQPVIICTDRYHVARCRWLFRMLGVATAKHPMISGRKANGAMRWTYYYMREFFALIWDTILLLPRSTLRTE